MRIGPSSRAQSAIAERPHKRRALRRRMERHLGWTVTFPDRVRRLEAGVAPEAWAQARAGRGRAVLRVLRLASALVGVVGAWVAYQRWRRGH